MKIESSNASAKYVVAGIGFRTQTALKAHCSALLRKPDLGADDDAFLRGLLDRHPEREQKLGVGIKKFFIRRNDYGKNGFWLERVDGTTTDFSFLACVAPPSHRANVRAAMRTLVKQQSIEFRDRAFRGRTTVLCAISGVPVTSDGAHVDHRPPKTFDKLVDAFLEEEGLDVERVLVEPTVDGVMTWGLADTELSRRWCEFHAKHCDFQIATTLANLSQGSGRSKISNP